MLRIHPRADRSADGAPKASSWRRPTTAAGSPAAGTPAAGSPAAGLPAVHPPTVGRRSDVERVYDDIFDAVMDRRLLPGTQLTEATLCSVFSCSRSVVRSAL